MRILIVTQKVDRADSYFGFFPSWIDRFAQECEQVTIITLERGTGTFPENVTVLSLGKESGPSRLRYLALLYRYAWRHRAAYDAVFCHMSPLYVIAGAPLWSVLGKPVALWYVHKHIDLKLRIATLLARRVLTASPESFRLATKKVRYLGQGVDTEALAPGDTPKTGKGTDALRVLTVGRITPVKRLEMLIVAAKRLIDQGTEVRVTFAGAPVMPRDLAYRDSLVSQARAAGIESALTLRGNVPFTEIANLYHTHDVSVNLAPTGGLDKAVLESLAAGTPAFAANRAFEPALGPYADRFLVDDAEDLAVKLAAWQAATDKGTVASALRAIVVERYSLDRLVAAIVQEIAALLPQADTAY